MPIKNKKTKSSPKNVKKKPTSSKSSGLAVKKAVKVSPKKKLPSKAKAPSKKPSVKKLATNKKKSSPAPKKVIKKAKPASVKKVSSKKVKPSPTKSRTKSGKVVTKAVKAAKVVQKKVVKAVKQVKKIAKPVKPIKLVKKAVEKAKPIKKITVLPLKNNVPTEPKKAVAKKPSIMNIIKMVAKKANSAQAQTQRVKRPGAGPSGFLPYEARQNEEYMSELQLTHFQGVLNLWKEQLYADRDATTQHMRDDTINFPDPLDRAALEEEHTLEWRAREREHRLIAKIDQALVRIKQGEYGYCEACGAEIGVRRLEARPTATQCIDCKTIDEIRERHTGTAE